MNISTSDCSSGCESGWTMYLDQSSYSGDQFHRGDYRSKRENVGVQHQQDFDVDEDEDLSMVSDASSGPRQLNEEDDESCNDRGGYFGYASEQRKANSQKKKIKQHREKKTTKNSYLDDTASSPVLSISKEHEASMEHVMGFKGKSALKKHFGFLKTSVPGKAASEKSGGFQGRKWQ